VDFLQPGSWWNSERWYSGKELFCGLEVTAALAIAKWALHIPSQPGALGNAQPLTLSLHRPVSMTGAGAGAGAGAAASSSACFALAFLVMVDRCADSSASCRRVSAALPEGED
jgi:hypothetical protein